MVASAAYPSHRTVTASFCAVVEIVVSGIAILCLCLNDQVAVKKMARREGHSKYASLSPSASLFPPSIVVGQITGRDAEYLRLLFTQGWEQVRVGIIPGTTVSEKP